MPIFDYECESCQIVTEKLVKSSDVDVHCSECTRPMVRLVGAPSFVLNGTGWYATDFRGDKPRHLKEKQNSEGWTRGTSDRFTDA